MIFAFLNRPGVYSEHSFIECGEYNGYVGWTPDEGELPEGDLDDLINIHGGITYNCTVDDEYMKKFFPKRILTGLPRSFDGCRIIGFDTCHYDDTRENWNSDRCTRETLSLYRQVKFLLSKK